MLHFPLAFLAMSLLAASSSKTNVLLIGSATNDMLAKLEENDIPVYSLRDPNVGMDWLKEHGHQITYVMTNGHDGLPSDCMPFLPNLKLISCNGVGYDGIDTESAIANNILVTHTPTVLNAETSTTAILLMLACYRNFLSCEQYARSGVWRNEGPHPLTRSADHRTVGLLGMGRIGQAIANKLLAFDCEVVYHARSQNDNLPYHYYSSLVDMAHHVDCLICIVPGGIGTNHLVNEQVMNALGPQGTLINVARGSVVDEQAMIKALQDGRLGWAGLDVFENEPNIPVELCTMNNVVLLPHVGSATVETRAAMGALTVDNILQHWRDGSVMTPILECRHLLSSEGAVMHSSVIPTVKSSVSN